MIRFTFICLFCVLISCKEDQTKPSIAENQLPLFSLLETINTNVTFSNNIIENDINNPFKYEYFYNGAGVSIGDINNDGLPDLYFTGNMVEDKLYLNKGDLEFEDITDNALGKQPNGWHTGITFADVNGDGNLDIIAAGNLYEAEIETVRYDAGRGICLFGDGTSNFKSLTP